MARLHREVMRRLTLDILNGVRPAGAMLPREVDLADEYEVSRGVARETIRAMEERGLISVKHGRGAWVNGPDQWDLFDPEVLAVALDTTRAGDVLAQYVECRRIMEVEAAGLAARRARKKDIAPMREALERMERTVDSTDANSEDRFHEADVAFHQALIAATGNHALGRLVARIHSALLVARYPLARPQFRAQRALPEHRRIMDAVANGDVEEARAAMNAHLDTVAMYLKEHIGQRSRRTGTGG